MAGFSVAARKETQRTGMVEELVVVVGDGRIPVAAFGWFVVVGNEMACCTGWVWQCLAALVPVSL